MNLEDQVCSIELAKKLLTLGVKQKSIFVWEYFDDKCYGVKFIPYAVVPHESNNCKLYPAFTSSELGEMLPNRITTKQNEPFNNFVITINKFISFEDELNPINKWIVNYECDSTELTGENAWFRRKLTNNIYGFNLANELAKMLIYLIENELIKNE